MLIIENDLAKKYIELVLPENLLNLKPVIAGGFVVSIYNNIIKYRQNRFMTKQLKSLFDNKNKSLYTKFAPNFKFDKMNSKFKNYDDIDCFFLNSDKNNVIKILSEHNNEKDAFNMLKPSLELLKEKENIFGNNTCFSKSSKWANTFVINAQYSQSEINLTTVQIISREFNSIDELFNNFDIINCCAAYYDGKFYFHDDFEKCFINLSLKQNLNFQKQSVYEKTWTYNRAFKYAERYNLEFEKDIVSLIVNDMQEIEEFYLKLNDDIYSSKKSAVAKQLLDISKLEPKYPEDILYGMDINNANELIKIFFAFFANCNKYLFLMKELELFHVLTLINIKQDVINIRVREIVNQHFQDKSLKKAMPFQIN